MTDVRKDDLTLVSTIDDVVALYQGNGLPLTRQTLGMETEICLYRHDASGSPVAATSAECATLLQYLKDAGHQPQLEMASAVEYASLPCRVDQVASLAQQIRSDISDYEAAIRAQGLIPSDGALLPFVTLESAGANLVDRDRARGLVKGMALFKEPEFLKVTLLCTSTQVSVSYKDADDLYDLLATGYALQPAIFGIFANHPATIENKDTPVDFHPRSKFYEAFGKDGAIPESFVKAQDGQDFIRRHIEQVFNNELLFYYDAAGEIIWPEKPVKFRDLSALGLNTRSNYDLSESFVYTDLKVCNIRDENGIAIGKRVEVRGFDAGNPGIHGALPFVHALLRDEQTNAAVKGLLQGYGVSPGQDGWQQRIVEARSAFANHGGKHLDVPFGTGNLKDFCRDLGDILHRYAARHPELDFAVLPIVDVCKTGISPAEQKASLHAAQTRQNAVKLSGYGR